MKKSAQYNSNTVAWNTKDIAVGSTLEGQYVAVETFEGKFGETTKYVIRTADGTDFGVYGSASINRQMKNVKLYSQVWITYKGVEETKNGRTVKVYDIEYDDAIELI